VLSNDLGRMSPSMLVAFWLDLVDLPEVVLCVNVSVAPLGQADPFARQNALAIGVAAVP